MTNLPGTPKRWPPGTGRHFGPLSNMGFVWLWRRPLGANPTNSMTRVSRGMVSRQTSGTEAGLKSARPPTVTAADGSRRLQHSGVRSSGGFRMASCCDWLHANARSRTGHMGDSLAMRPRVSRHCVAHENLRSAFHHAPGHRADRRMAGFIVGCGHRRGCGPLEFVEEKPLARKGSGSSRARRPNCRDLRGARRFRVSDSGQGL